MCSRFLKYLEENPNLPYIRLRGGNIFAAAKGVKAIRLGANSLGIAVKFLAKNGLTIFIREDRVHVLYDSMPQNLPLNKLKSVSNKLQTAYDLEIIKNDLKFYSPNTFYYLYDCLMAKDLSQEEKSKRIYRALSEYLELDPDLNHTALISQLIELIKSGKLSTRLARRIRREAKSRGIDPKISFDTAFSRLIELRDLERFYKTLALNYLPRKSLSKYCRRFITFHY